VKKPDFVWIFLLTYLSIYLSIPFFVGGYRSQPLVATMTHRAWRIGPIQKGLSTGVLSGLDPYPQRTTHCAHMNSGLVVQSFSLITDNMVYMINLNKKLKGKYKICIL